MTTAADTLLRRRNRRGEATREALLKATLTCLQRGGYGATSIEAVMAEAGVGRGSVLNQFPTRLELMLAVAELAMAAMLDQARTALDQVDDPLDRIRALADVAWTVHNGGAATALTEILLASRWDHTLAQGLRPIVEPVDLRIDRMNAQLARDVGIADLTRFLIHGRLLGSNMRGLTIELMFNANRTMIQDAVATLKQGHVELVDSLLAESPIHGWAAASTLSQTH
ncbi:MAG: hypothetical protein RIQ99_1623 [Pseudomonadota bacterium]|jgi:AcrR family transcriptional regulator